MKLLNVNRIKPYVLSRSNELCVSIYLPLGHSIESRMDAPRRLGKIVRHIEAQLAESHPNLVEWYVAPLRALMSRFPVTVDGKTLAIFRSGRIAVMTALPTMESEACVIADSFHVKPLLSHIQESEEEVPALARRTDLVRHLRRALLQGRLRSNLAEIAIAAVHGKIQALWLRRGVSIRGQLNRANGEVKLQGASSAAYTDDVLDDIAEIVLSRGGTVKLDNAAALTSVASGAPAVAVLRRSA